MPAPFPPPVWANIPFHHGAPPEIMGSPLRAGVVHLDIVRPS
jgi:hypothetical protein